LIRSKGAKALEVGLAAAPQTADWSFQGQDRATLARLQANLADAAAKEAQLHSRQTQLQEAQQVWGRIDFLFFCLPPSESVLTEGVCVIGARDRAAGGAAGGPECGAGGGSQGGEGARIAAQEGAEAQVGTARSPRRPTGDTSAQLTRSTAPPPYTPPLRRRAREKRAREAVTTDGAQLHVDVLSFYYGRARTAELELETEALPLPAAAADAARLGSALAGGDGMLVPEPEPAFTSAERGDQREAEPLGGVSGSPSGATRQLSRATSAEDVVRPPLLPPQSYSAAAAAQVCQTLARPAGASVRALD
jgi:hypothetical protein